MERLSKLSLSNGPLVSYPYTVWWCHRPNTMGSNGAARNRSSSPPETHGPVLVGRPPDQQSRNEVSFEVSQKTVLQEKHLCSLQPIAYGIHPGQGFQPHSQHGIACSLHQHKMCNNNNGPDCLVQLLAWAPKSTASLVLCVGQFPHRYVTSSV